jgi:uncharacterized LabA/DUF88 family protein
MSGVVWLIDAAYVLKGHQGNIDYLSMRRFLQEWAIPERGGRFDTIIFYNSYREQDLEKARPFYDKLQANGFQVKLYPLKKMGVTCQHCNTDGERFVQKGVDIAIATDMLSLAYEGKCKRIVLTAGDGDFLDAVQRVRKIFREVYLAAYQRSCSNELAYAADRVYWLQN